MIYDNFEKDFKEKSISVRFFKYKITIFTILYLSLLLISYLSNKLGYPIINGGVYILGNMILAYILYFNMVIKRLNIKNIYFWDVLKNIKRCRGDLRKFDLKVVKDLCDKYGINHEKQLSEMISHYRSIKTNTSFISICLTIVSIAITLIPLFISGGNYKADYLMTIILVVILVVSVICYLIYDFYDMFIRARTKNELYKNLEEYLSEIYLKEVSF